MLPVGHGCHRLGSPQGVLLKMEQEKKNDKNQWRMRDATDGPGSQEHGSFLRLVPVEPLYNLPLPSGLL